MESLYLWLAGKSSKPDNAESILSDLLELVWHNPFVDGSELMSISWDRWTGPLGSSIGQFYRFSQIALKIEEGESVTSSDLALISNMSVSHMESQMAEGKLSGEKLDTGWVIPSAEAKNWISKQTSPSL